MNHRNGIEMLCLQRGKNAAVWTFDFQSFSRRARRQRRVAPHLSPTGSQSQAQVPTNPASLGRRRDATWQVNLARRALVEVG